MDANLRKVAVLIASLDRGAVDAILEGLNAAEAHRVRRAVIELGAYPEEEGERVIEEFLSSAKAPVNVSPDGSGVELVLSDTHAHVSNRGHSPRESTRRVADHDAFAFLDNADVSVLGELLASEHPQVIALIVSRLDADRAALLLAKLHRDTRESVLRRLMDIQDVDKSVAVELLEQVHRRLREHESRIERRAMGLGRVSRILEAARARNERSTSARDRAAVNTNQYGSMGGSAWTIEDLERADDASLATILGETEPDVLEMALLGVPSGIVQRVLRHLPAKEARVLRRRVAQPGPTSLRDMDQARHMVLLTAARLETEGRIRPRRASRLSLAV